MYNIINAYGKLLSMTQADVTATTHGSVDGCCHGHESKGFRTCTEPSSEGCWPADCPR